MSKYLKKFETTAQYDAAKSGLILPNVSLCVQENEVHYKPSTPPTPSLSVVAVYDGDEEVELPYCEISTIKFNRPITQEELLGLKIVASDQDGCSYDNEYVYTYSYIEGNSIVWKSNDAGVYLFCDTFEGTTDTIYISHGDYLVKYFRFYFE